MLSPAASQTESQTTTTASSSDTEDKDTPANGHTPKDTNNEQPRPQTASGSPNVEYSSEDHGQTDYVRMRKRDHSVAYEHTVDVIARMRVYKGELNSEPLKLVVEQVRVYLGDHVYLADDLQLPNEINSESYRGSPLRIGHRYINLAEFVSEGKLRRKYLLESSKTNAMISVSLDITVIKAQAEFTKCVLSLFLHLSHPNLVIYVVQACASTGPYPNRTERTTFSFQQHASDKYDCSPLATLSRSILSIRIRIHCLLDILVEPRLCSAPTPSHSRSKPQSREHAARHSQRH